MLGRGGLAAWLLLALVPSGGAQELGSLATYAGKYSGDPDNGVPAVSAALGAPYSVAVDPQGNVFVGEYNLNRVRRVDATTGSITAMVGSKTPCAPPASCGEGGPSTAALLDRPRWMATDSDGNLYIAEYSGLNRVRMVRASDGVMVPIAGGGSQAIGSTDCVLATRANVPISGGIAVGAKRNLYIAGTRVYRVGPEGKITTVAGAGTPSPGKNGDGGAAMAARFSTALTAITCDARGALYVADGARIRKIEPGADGVVTGADDEIITTVAGTGVAGAATDFVKATAAQLNSPAGLAVNTSGDLFILDAGVARVRRVVAGLDHVVNGTDDELMTTVAGGGALPPADGIAGTDARFTYLRGGICLDAKGNLLIADGAYYVYRIAGLAGAPSPVGVGPGMALGDLNGDGKIDVRDAILSLRAVAGLVTLDPFQAAAGDVTKDGKLTVADTIAILLTVVGYRSPCF
jgi:hypothetical protein